ncbi:MAG: ABC transporter ATP-binding protein [Oscillospiraceae bacterium]|jgi:putative ABC transport system ATP-binding protein|nr:ABC transporter ATP-binding protein [Oscillospiraceae bacterium]
MEHLVELHDIYKIYGEGLESEVRALNGVNLIIDRGEFVAIVGSSGSGKSTMMNILGCLDQPTYGDYLLNGELASELDDRELSRIRNKEIGFIFQGFNLISELSALENVELPLVYGNWKYKREAAMEALERVSLAARAEHKPSEMSGGQQQRVAIARAIVTNPPIIMADEPTGNLDSKTSSDVMDLLKQFHGEGSTVILITHDNSIAEAADRVIKVLDGKIVSDVTKPAVQRKVGI